MAESTFEEHLDLPQSHIKNLIKNYNDLNEDDSNKNICIGDTRAKIDKKESDRDINVKKQRKDIMIEDLNKVKYIDDSHKAINIESPIKDINIKVTNITDKGKKKIINIHKDSNTDMHIEDSNKNIKIEDTENVIDIEESGFEGIVADPYIRKIMQEHIDMKSQLTYLTKQFASMNQRLADKKNEQNQIRLTDSKNTRHDDLEMSVMNCDITEDNINGDFIDISNSGQGD